MAGQLAAYSIHELLGVLVPVARAIAATIGPHCEVVIHDLRERESGNTIVWIENGQVTGRRVGGPTSNLGLEAIASHDPNPDRFDYRTRTPDGRLLRSSSIYFRDPTGELIGALCINLDISTIASARHVLEALSGDGVAETNVVRETFGRDIDDVLDGLIEEAAVAAGSTDGRLPSMTRDERIAFVRALDERGAFLVKRAVARVAAVLGVSRMTAYTYLQEARAARPASAAPVVQRRD